MAFANLTDRGVVHYCKLRCILAAEWRLVINNDLLLITPLARRHNVVNNEGIAVSQ